MDRPAFPVDASVHDLTDIIKEAEKRFGPLHPLCKKSSLNPRTPKVIQFLSRLDHQPGCYRKSLWTKAGKPNGTEHSKNSDRLRRRDGRRHKIDSGIGLSQELNSNMAARALLWSYDSGVQDAKENVVLNNPETDRGGRV